MNRPAQSHSISATPPNVSSELASIARLITNGAYRQDVRYIKRAIRWTMKLRNNLTDLDISDFLIGWIQTEFKDDELTGIDTTLLLFVPPEDYFVPEVAFYGYFICLMFLIDDEKYVEVMAGCSFIFEHFKRFNRRTTDVLASKIYFYYSLAYELGNNLDKIRRNFLALYQTAKLRHDALGQETLFNLLLRNYLHDNLYDQAEKLISKAPRFEGHSNNQLCRYLFYLGKIRTIRLEYSDAKESLLQAAMKAPASAIGFRILCNKWAIIVRLLLGEIPERNVFMQKGMENALRPYFELTNAVRIGDLELFETIAAKFLIDFFCDRTDILIARLRHSVIRIGLRNISISYSRISLADVAKKLRLDISDVESIVSKAVRDGVIDAKIDHSNGWMISKEKGDVYSSNEPQTAFHSRIVCCLNMHNEAVRAIRAVRKKRGLRIRKLRSTRRLFAA